MNTCSRFCCVAVIIALHCGITVQLEHPKLFLVHPSLSNTDPISSTTEQSDHSNLLPLIPSPNTPDTTPSTTALQQANTTDHKNTPAPVTCRGERCQYFFGLYVPYTLSFSCERNSDSAKAKQTRLCHNDTDLESSGTHCSTSHTYNCRCDDECLLFKDCCIDALANIPETHLRSPEYWYRHTHTLSFATRFLPLMAKYSKCTLLKIGNATQTVKVIDSCPADSDLTLKQKCSRTGNGITAIPASLRYNMKWQVVFRNMFCAFCHGITQHQLLLWQYSVRCPNDIQLNNTSPDFSQCKQHALPPERVAGKLRDCPYTASSILTCQDEFGAPNNDNDSGEKQSSYNLACEWYIGPVQMMLMVYRNIHCMFCSLKGLTKNTYVKALTAEYVDKYGVPHLPLGHHHGSGGSGYPQAVQRPTVRTESKSEPTEPKPMMLVMFNFDFIHGLSFRTDDHQDYTYHENYACGSGEQFEYNLGECRETVCPSDEVKINSTCVKNNQTIYLSDNSLFPELVNGADNRLFITVAVKAIRIFSVAEIAQIHDTIKEAMHEVGIFAVTFDTMHTMHTHATHRDGRVTSSMDSIPIAELSYIIDDGSISEILTRMTDLSILLFQDGIIQPEVIHVQLSNMKRSNQYHCRGGDHTLTFKGSKLQIEDEIVYALIRGRELINLNVARFQINIYKPSDQNFTVVTCSHLRCPMVQLTDDEYYIVNDSVVLNGSDNSAHEYELRNGSVHICSGARLPTPLPVVDDMLLYQMYIVRITAFSSTALSILGLVLTIVIYIRSESVRTIHGRCVVSLSSVMIVAQTISLISVRVHGLICIAFGIIAHWSWLATFAWMSIISYDMMRIFIVLRTRKSSLVSDHKRFIMYSLIAWGIPSLIVLPCMVLYFATVTTSVSMQYGTEGTCVTNNALPVFIFFTIPLIVSVLFNFVSFAMTVYGIQRSRRNNPLMKQTNDKLFLLIYFKMSVIMGITWIFAIMASATGMFVFLMIHAIVNGLQGVFIFISFALRAQVCHCMKRRRTRKMTSITFS